MEWPRVWPLVLVFVSLSFLSILQSVYGDDLASCTYAPITPKRGICAGYVFKNRVCTGSSTLFKLSSSALMGKSSELAQLLESYAWSEYCRVDVTAKCKSYLPSTVAAMNPTCPNSQFLTDCDCLTLAVYLNITENFDCSQDSDCQCAAGKYGNQQTSNCPACKICDANAATSNPCVAGSASDTVVCTCNAGYWGDGSFCSPCKVCDLQATTSGTPCNGKYPYDPVACTCNGGYYGNGVQCNLCSPGYYGMAGACRLCKTCNASATVSGSPCISGSTADSVICTCNNGYSGNGVSCVPCDAGYYGSGGVCIKCRQCDINGEILSACGVGGTADTVSCRCKSGYYGSGYQDQSRCIKCKICDAQASTSGSCPAGSTADNINCTCNDGYYGDGVTCTPCKRCDSLATASNLCVKGSSVDTVTCKCIENYYGTGISVSSTTPACFLCKVCHQFATNSSWCPAGSAADTIKCTCNRESGWYGSGTSCSLCHACGDNSKVKQGTSCDKARANTAVDTVQCICNAGYYSINSTTTPLCKLCRTCDPHAITNGSCLEGATADTVTCSCNAGYFGDGFTCNPCLAATYSQPNSTSCTNCTVCHLNATTGNACAGVSGSDTVKCVCNTGFYGNGTSCSPCRMCHSNATIISNCSATSAVSCKCNSGYYGDGFICTPCSVCDTSAAVLKDCSNAGDRTCRCNIGFYGSGYAGFCFACKQCIGNSTAGGSACSTIGLTSDTVTCACNLGFYGDGYSSCQLCPSGKYTDGVRCINCTVCSVNANTTGTPCLPYGTSDTVRCSCNSGYYGNGTICQLCKSCDSNATNTGSNCTLPDQLTDPKVCVCNAGFYGSGTSCSLCRTCHPNATLTLPGASCTNGALTDTVICKCNVGFGGDGYKNCTQCPADFYEQSRICKPCRTCDTNAFRSGSCLAGGTEDVVACTCNAGYYGYGSSDRLPCILCKTCNSFATMYASCPRGSVTDVTNCTCNAGFGGDGLNCASCSDGNYSDTGSCKPCKTCHANATIFSPCVNRSTSDTVKCVCNAGYYGNGSQCTPCKTCSLNASNSGIVCGSGFQNDTVNCICNAGFWGNGTSCTPCKVCSANGTYVTQCAAGSSSDTVTCNCSAGYYGNGFACNKCSSCSQFATQLRSCPANTVADVVTCSCNAGYYGTGFNCSACKTCHPLATQPNVTCIAGQISDTVICSCRTGYSGDGVQTCNVCPVGTYGTGVSCLNCTVCHPNASTGLPCGVASISDTVTCSCNLGFYGDGKTCKSCAICSPNSTNRGKSCAPGSLADSNLCICNSGFYGDGTVQGTGCQNCTKCSPNAAISLSCPGSTSVDVVRCTCNAGYYGDGKVCAPCQPCDASATPSSQCLLSNGNIGTTGSCSCNAGFYGNGYKCGPCRACDVNARLNLGTSCFAGSATDTVTCSCNTGFTGDGFNCTSCSNGTLGWLYNFCYGANQSLVQQYIIAPGDYRDICDLPSISPCQQSLYRADRSILTAGDETLSTNIAQSTFVPALVSPNTVLKIMNAAFLKCTAGDCPTPCLKDKLSGGYRCDGPVSLVSIPGLILKTVRGVLYPTNFALGINTSSPPTGSKSITALTAFTRDTDSLNLSVQLNAFPLASSSRRATGCAPGTVWRYVRQGVPVTAQTACFPECANTQCAGVTTCAIVPVAGDVWQVVPSPASLCVAVIPTPPPANLSVVPAFPSTSSQGWTPDLALGLGLGLGIGIPVILLGLVAMQLARRPKAAPPPKQPATDLLFI